MISWIVAWHDWELLERELLTSLHLEGTNDELVLVEAAPSITTAYADGQQRAHHQIHCYVHSDIRILDFARFRTEIITTATDAVGIVGVIGSRSMVLPWWNGDLLGSVNDNRLGTLNFGPGGPCAVVDGIILATVHTIDWDLTWPGWHGYEYDSCTQMQRAGKQNWCLSSGSTMVTHNNDSPIDVNSISGWHDAVAHYTKKWHN